jgi:leucyl-tRNA synthetase
MANKYNHKEIENKWREAWSDTKIYQTPEIHEGSKEKMYILDMFPYPSGAGLHVGHVEGYTATDIVSRYYRMLGKDVLHPMGWDAFGLPAENYAIKTGTHPRISTNNSIVTFKKQIDAVGLSYDWSREIGAHNPDYYKWTQWFFLFLYKKGLAYKKEASINWCPTCMTVLANEQVIDGKCERCDSEVSQKKMSQWFFKITDYADRLIEDLKKVDWPESTKINQINWIGRSEGAEVEFSIVDSQSSITVFTTRVDTLFSGTFLILAPDHQLVNEITTPKQRAEVEKYVETTKKKTELERTGTEQDKSGVFTGAYAINPATNEQIPVWISDFVLANYGTGAVFADAHDERDFEMAKKYGIALKTSIRPMDGSDDTKYRELTECFSDDGILYNSGQFDGMTSAEARPAITKWLSTLGKGNAKVTYRLRDWSVSRQRFWGAPIPIVYDKDGNAIPVDEADLPIMLPDDVEFMPTGRSPLHDHPDFAHAPAKYGEGARREPDTLDTFVCSSWYFFRFCDPKNPNAFASKEAMQKWGPVDIYVGGAEHTVLHLMYARFFTKVLFDAGYINFDEPFINLRHPGMILGEDGRKMSKRWGNIINPLDVINELGADALRMYEMFMGPFDQMKPWNVNTIQGVRRFLDRVYNLNELVNDSDADNKVEVELQKLIKKVGQDIANFKFNTSVAEFMKFTNLIEEKRSITTDQWKRFVKVLAPFAPYITEELWHKINGTDKTTKEESIHLQPWPTFDPEMIKADTVIIGIQINGKLRAQVEVSLEESESTVKDRVLAMPDVTKWIEGNEVRKFIYVPGKIANIVV